MIGSRKDGKRVNPCAGIADHVRMETRPEIRLDEEPRLGEPVREAKPDSLASIAVDANALAGAIGSGRGEDLGRLIEDLLRERPAA